jgi:hypothetical protein
MNHGIFAATTRRASLLTLATAGLAALAQPIAGKGRKGKRKQRRNGDANKLCKKQVGQCFDIFAPTCEDSPACQAELDICCPVLGRCDFGGFFTCLDETMVGEGLVSP